jgi:ATP-dependent Clp protease ATP-binding subunit ClpC
VFERFSERAGQVIVLAVCEARELPHASIGSEHLLLGLVAERRASTQEPDVALRILSELGVDLSGLREAVERLTPSSGEGRP